jgi:hypothetical protein
MKQPRDNAHRRPESPEPQPQRPQAGLAPDHVEDVIRRSSRSVPSKALGLSGIQSVRVLSESQLQKLLTAMVESSIKSGPAAQPEAAEALEADEVPIVVLDLDDDDDDDDSAGSAGGRAPRDQVRDDDGGEDRGRDHDDADAEARRLRSEYQRTWNDYRDAQRQRWSALETRLDRLGIRLRELSTSLKKAWDAVQKPGGGA